MNTNTKENWTVTRYDGKYYWSPAYDRKKWDIIPDDAVEEELPFDHTFDGELRYDCMIRTSTNRLIVRFIDVNDRDRLFCMLPKTFDSIAHELRNGIIRGTFGFEKKGSIVGIKLVNKTDIYVEDFVKKYKDYHFKVGEEVLASNSIVRCDYWAKSTYKRFGGKDSLKQNHHYINGGRDYFFYCLPLNEEVINFCKTRGGFDVSYTQNIVFLPIDEWEKYQDLIDKACMCWDRFEDNE